MSSNATLHVLPNGLQVLLEENHSAPVVSLSVVVKAGSAMETADEAGISHFIEHMLFKGTPTRPVGQIAYTVEAAGGEINAYTSFDHTVYYINMATRFADVGLEILADAVQHPLFASDEITREAEVICEEIRRGDDNPGHVLSEMMFRHTYAAHPYGRPIIGSAASVKGFRREHLHSYWQRWYSADNCVFIMVGDFDSATALPKIEAAFGDLPHERGAYAPELAVPIVRPGPRAFQYLREIQTSYFGICFPIPHVVHADIPGLDLLSHILGGSDSSRLDQVVREQQRLVQAIYSYAYSARGNGVFVIGGQTPSAKVPKTLQTTWGEIRRVQDGLVSAAEMERARLNIISSALYERETVGGQAGKYAYHLATSGSHTFDEHYYRAIAAATREQVQHLAQQYLHSDAATCTWLAPKRDRIASSAAIRKIFHTPPPRGATIPGPRRPITTTEFSTAQGLRCIVRRDDRLPLVACYAAMLGGTRYETARNNGINTLLAQTITKGTATHDAASFAETIDAMAGSIDASSGRNTFGIKAEFLSSKMNEGFALFGEVLRAPSLVADEVEKERTRLLHAIRNQQDQLHVLASINFHRALFGQHPYALPHLGTKTSVRQLTASNLARYYRMIAHPRAIVLAMAGDIDVPTAKALAERHFHWAQAPRIALPRIPALRAVKTQTLQLHRAAKQQAHIMYGVRGTTITAPDRYAFMVLNHILSGQGGRLFLTLRDQMSLAYSVHSTLQMGIEPGYFGVYIGTEPSKVTTAVDQIRALLAELMAREVRDDELERAQQHMVGTYELDLQRNLSVASLHALNVLFGLGVADMARYPTEVLKVTKRDLLQVARRYLRPTHAVCSIVTP